MTLTFRPFALASLLFAALPAIAASPAGLKDALDGERIGLLPAERFRVSTGNCTDCATLPQALWYFKDDVIAVPGDAQPTPALPGLVWLGAPQILDDAAIHPDGRQLRTREGGDVFKALGWHVPERGATSRLKAIGAYAYLAAKEASLRSGRKIYDYLTEEQVRLYPAVAFEAAGHDLLALVGATPGLARTLSPFEQQLKGDVEAIMLVRIPQVPSSRAMGSNPVFSFDEFMARTPPDQKDWKIAPVGPRPFPAALRAGAPEASSLSPVPWPVAVIVAALAAALWLLVRRWRSKKPRAA